MGNPPEILVVGAGLVGSLSSVYLRRRGLDVEVCERRPDPRSAAIVEGRSINLVVTSRGIEGLRRVGLWEKVARLSVPVRGRALHGPDGSLAFQPYGRDASEVNYSVSRAELNRFLVDEGERAGARFHFSERLARRTEKGWAVESLRGERLLSPAVTLATDGANSQARAELERAGECHVRVETLEYGYKELVLPKGPAGYRIDGSALHIWPRGRFMMMALPNRDGSFTVTLYLPFKGDVGFEALEGAGAPTKFFETHFPDALALVPDLEADFAGNPVGSLATVYCDRWYGKGNVLLLGDAAHAIVPFFGQGMNSGFEDLLVLDDWLASGDGNWAEGCRRVFESRKPDTDAIAEMALQNFIEMRDRVGDCAFLLRKAVDGLLEKKFPDKYRTRYALVAYTLVPYRVALEAGVVQERLLERLCAGVKSPEQVDLAAAERLIDSEIVPLWRARGVRTSKERR